MKLTDLKIGESGYILKIKGTNSFRRRVTEMGFVKGQRVDVLFSSPLKDPITYGIMGYELSLRNNEAEAIEITQTAPAKMRSECGGTCSVSSCQSKCWEQATAKESVIEIALIGNPNSGKTSLFNAISGGQERVGNYSGVTVTQKVGHITYKGYRFNITDLPGTYSLAAYSAEEKYVQYYLETTTPDVVVNVIAASNLKRHLYLTTDLMDRDMRVVGALNMYDELLESGSDVDVEAMAKGLGMPLVPVVAKSAKGVTALLDKILEVVSVNESLYAQVSIDYSDILKGEQEASTETIGRKYDFIDNLLSRTLTCGAQTPRKESLTAKVDNIVTNKWLGFPIFVLLMWLTFSATFTLGGYPQEWIEMGVEALAECVEGAMSDGWLKSFIIDGVIGGAGGVLVFLPNIVILYLFIVLLESSGYMVRAAFIMDRLMRHVGLDGHAFIPMLMGFGCNVPAIMATRTIEDSKSRLISILINPFVSCSARLPVFILLAGTFIPAYGALAITGVYILGIVVAALTAILLRRFIKIDGENALILEFPPYRMPTTRSVVKQLWNKCKLYITRIGKIILLASAIIWALDYFPSGENQESQQDSYLSQVGRITAPIVEPMGLDWRASVSLLTGIAAKEIVVSTMGVLYSDNNQELIEEGDESSAIADDFSLPSAIAFMIFVLLYFPCTGTLAAIKGETNSWKWVGFSILYSTGVAWVLAYVAYILLSLIV